MFSTGGDTSCQQCSAGYSCTVDGVLTACTTQQYSPVGNPTCLTCPSGSICPTTADNQVLYFLCFILFFQGLSISKISFVRPVQANICAWKIHDKCQNVSYFGDLTRFDFSFMKSCQACPEIQFQKSFLVFKIITYERLKFGQKWSKQGPKMASPEQSML